MKILLDTHTFIWWDSSKGRLSADALALCMDISNTLLLSMASVWEMQIKIQLGKLNLALPLEKIIKDQQQLNNLQLLPIELSHVLAHEKLPFHHKDPFDRMLIAQAIAEDIVILSDDSIFTTYSIKVRW
ncbi:MAG: type II toxin-antitoxin system VapC family toxin [Acidobacteriota bacterium]